jgi:hypothetical protein
MQEHLGFLNVSSAVVKVAAWIFLFFGVVGGIAILTGKAVSPMTEQYGAWVGWILLAGYAFLFFFLILIAKIADLLVKIINKIDK